LALATGLSSKSALARALLMTAHEPKHF